jgi:hypothetical protein
MNMKAIAVTSEEGGEWLPFVEGQNKLVHAIKFDNGAIWDAYNGWRTVNHEMTDLEKSLREVAA